MGNDYDPNYQWIDLCIFENKCIPQDKAILSTEEFVERSLR